MFEGGWVVFFFFFSKGCCILASASIQPECRCPLYNNNLILLKILGAASRGVECSKNTLAGLRVSKLRQFLEGEGRVFGVRLSLTWHSQTIRIQGLTQQTPFITLGWIKQLSVYHGCSKLCNSINMGGYVDKCYSATEGADTQDNPSS